MVVLFSYTNGAYEFSVEFCVVKFSSLGKDSMDYGIRSGKSLSLGMPRKASPLSTLSIGNFTWSYIFIHHMICVLLGASFYFLSFFLMLVIIMFCIFSFNKKSRIAFAMLILLVCMLLFENRKFTAVAKIP